VKAKAALHVVNVAIAQSAVNVRIAASAQTVIAQPVKAAVMAVHPHAAKAWLKVNAPTT
jgi:hypothetical protein